MNIMPYLNILLFVLVGFGAYMLGRVDEQRKQINIHYEMLKRIFEDKK